MLNQSGRSDHSYLTSSKSAQRLVTGKVLLSIAVASILSSTAVAAEGDEMVMQAAVTDQEAVPTATLDTIVVRAAREELEQAAGLSIDRKSVV